jgi:hypothetical protein
MADHPAATAVAAGGAGVSAPEDLTGRDARRVPGGGAARAAPAVQQEKGARAVPAARQVQEDRRVRAARVVLRVRAVHEAREPRGVRAVLAPPPDRGVSGAAKRARAVLELPPGRGARRIRREVRGARRDRLIRERTRMPARAVACRGAAAQPGAVAGTHAPVKAVAQTRREPGGRAGAGTLQPMTRATRERLLADARPDAAAETGPRQRRGARAAGRVAVPGRARGAAGAAAPSRGARPVGPARHDLSDVRRLRLPSPRSCVCRPSWHGPAWLRVVPARS